MTFRYQLDNILISEKHLTEYEKRQNILIKRIFGISKFTRTTQLNRALRLESIKQIYLKHKLFFLKQIINDEVCRKVFESFRKDYKPFDRCNKSFIKQISDLENFIHVDLLNMTKYL